MTTVKNQSSCRVVKGCAQEESVKRRAEGAGRRAQGAGHRAQSAERRA